VRAGIGLTLARAALAAAALGALAWVSLSPDATGLTHALTRDIVLALRRGNASAPVTLVGVERAYPPAAATSPPDDERRAFAEAIDRLTKLGAKLIVLAPALDRAGPRAASDDALEAAIRRSGRVVLGEDAPESWWMEAARMALPLERFARAARGAGFVTSAPDLDGVARRIAPAVMFRGEPHRHVAFAVAEALGAPIADAALPRDRYDMLLLDYAQAGRVPRIPLPRLLAGAEPDAALKPLVDGRVVVVGQADPAAVQSFPFAPERPLGEHAWASADELTALAIACVLERALLADLGPSTDAWSLAALVLAAALCYKLGGLAALALLAFLACGAWGAALALAARGELLDAWALSRGLAIVGAARLADSWLARRARLKRLTALLAEQSRRALDPTNAAGGGARAGLDVALLAELLPERYSDPVLIGQGGMGMVCRAHDRVRREDVALKILPPSVQLAPRALERFLTEVRLLQENPHPGLVRVHDVNTDTLPFFTMELLSGRSLDRHLTEKGPQTPFRAVLFVREVAEVLAFLHRRGIVHRDVKPSNVMVLEDGSVKLLDLGVARNPEAPGLTATGDLVGTLGYMSPEQLSGAPAGAVGDVYAAGVLLCECLTGRVPARDGAVHAVPHDALKGCGASPELVDLIARLLDPRPSARPADGTALLAALDAVAPTVEG
jgi:hypothetical protein